MKKVTLIIETSLASGRQILSGIAKYAQEQNDWLLFKHSGQLGTFDPAAVTLSESDGIIARINSKLLLDSITESKKPTIDILGNFPNPHIPVIGPDNEKIGKKVASHFLESGFRSLAFYGAKSEAWSQQRQFAFKSTATETKATYSEKLNANSETIDGHWMQNLMTWLKELPKPTGLLIASDQYAPLLFEAAHQARLMIPQQLSIIGVDNDSVFCDLCHPPLSSIEPGHLKIGYEAAKRLDAMMKKSKDQTALFSIAPPVLHQRRSSTVRPVADEALAKALHYIAQNACRGISVDDVAAEAGVSRSVLQRKFKTILQESVGNQILYEKIRRAKELLQYSEHPIIRVSEIAGFTTQEYMNFIFRKYLDTTPRQYRKQHANSTQH